jgi:hypothetical protein
VRLHGLEQQSGNATSSVLLSDVEIVDVDELTRGERRKSNEASDDSYGLSEMESEKNASSRMRAQPIE